jgi:hypothetical protein
MTNIDNLYDSETDGATADVVSSIKEHCDFCGGTGKVWFGANGYDYEYSCPRCNKDLNL